jgi:hypothetical protein
MWTDVPNGMTEKARMAGTTAAIEPATEEATVS